MRSIFTPLVLLIAGADAPPPKAHMVITNPCWAWKDFEPGIKKEAGEAPVSIGMQGDKSIVRLFLSERGSFTVVVVYPNGLTCVLATGADWEQSEVQKGEPL